MRTGLVFEKLGMSSVYKADGTRIAVTLLRLADCQVVEIKGSQSENMVHVKIGYGQIKRKNVKKPIAGIFAKAKVALKRHLIEFKVSKPCAPKVGDVFSVNHYVPGQLIDITGVTVGKGFAGAMKRWNFRGLEATHGVSVSHRSHGSTGQRQDPGKTFKNKKMAGHLGVENVTIQNLTVIAVDPERNVLVVKGAVPGHKNGYVFIKDAVKAAVPANAPYPAGIVANVIENNGNADAS